MKKTIVGMATMLLIAGTSLYAGGVKVDSNTKSNSKSCACSKECCKSCGSKDCTCCK